MPISFHCPCGNTLEVGEDWAGRRVNCRACGRSLQVPADLSPPELAAPDRLPPADPQRGAAGPPVGSNAPVAVASGNALARVRAPARRHVAFLALLLAFIPLVFSLFGRPEDAAPVRLQRTLDGLAGEARERLGGIIGEIEQRRADPDELLRNLPGRRIEGAHLPLDTWAHFAYAALAAGGFLALTAVLLPGKSGRPAAVLPTGLFSGTVGVLLLLLVRWVAEWTQSFVVLRGPVLVAALYWVAAAIGYSYRAALDPDQGFLASFLGFTFGVGLCEEVCKALPLIWYYRRDEPTDWREGCARGFASGVGFGIAEAIVYSAGYYNGVAPAGSYVVRFVSCVALHGVWTASVALFMHRHQVVIQGELEWYEFVANVLILVAVPVLLHGLYDTALKKDMSAVALAAAAASIAWFTWCFERVRRDASESAPARAGR